MKEIRLRALIERDNNKHYLLQFIFLSSVSDVKIVKKIYYFLVKKNSSDVKIVKIFTSETNEEGERLCNLVFGFFFL